MIYIYNIYSNGLASLPACSSLDLAGTFGAWTVQKADRLLTKPPAMVT